MERWKRAIGSTVVLIGMLANGVALSWAVTADVTVSASVTPRTELSFIRDANSVTSRGTESRVVFNQYDDVDQVGGSPVHMYAPYRSETGKNWHLASLVANGSTMTLSADVIGDAGGTPLKNILDVFMGNFTPTTGGDKGGASSNWELLDTFSRILNEPFSGTAAFSYRLRLLGVPASGTDYTGTITFTLTSS